MSVEVSKKYGQRDNRVSRWPVAAINLIFVAIAALFAH
jgi:hypothetical protein